MTYIVDTKMVADLTARIEALNISKDFVLLVDMDGVICDWQKRFDNGLRRGYPHIPVFPFEKVTSFKTQSFYDVKHKADIADMMNEPGFYAELEAIHGSVEALLALEAAGVTVYLCTAPYVTHKSCASEKMDWVERHLGARWLNKMIITSDKTMVIGDVLIDDKPNITGFLTPGWHHVVFDAPYNRGMEPRLNVWDDIVDVLAEFVRNRV